MCAADYWYLLKLLDRIDCAYITHVKCSSGCSVSHHAVVNILRLICLYPPASFSPRKIITGQDIPLQCQNGLCKATVRDDSLTASSRREIHTCLCKCCTIKVAALFAFVDGKLSWLQTMFLHNMKTIVSLLQVGFVSVIPGMSRHWSGS